MFHQSAAMFQLMINARKLRYVSHHSLDFLHLRRSHPRDGERLFNIIFYLSSVDYAKIAAVFAPLDIGSGPLTSVKHCLDLWAESLERRVREKLSHA
jgi:hypothetical protein